MINKIKYSLIKNHLKKPIYLIFFVTNKCNSRCQHCFFSKELNKREKSELSLSEIENVSRELGKLVWVSLSGGEPFLRKDIFEIYKTFVDNNKVDNFSIPTNGICSEDIYNATKRMLVYNKVKNLTITLSLEGPKKIHDEIRGVPCYDKLIETYNKLSSLKKDYKNFSIMLSTTLSNKNIAYIDKLHEEVKQKMPAISFHNLEILRGVPKNSFYTAPTIKQLKDIEPTLHRIWRHYNYYSSRFQSKIAFNTKKKLHEEYIKILETGKQPWPCYAGTVHAVLDYTGDVFPCELLPKIGNIREESFTNIWNSEKANKMRQYIKARSCSCTHSCFQITNLTFNQKYWFNLIK